MIEIALMVLIVLLVTAFGLYVFWKDKQHHKQINHLINAIVAKNPQDLTNLTLAEQTRVDLENQPPLGPISDEFVPIGGADPSTFDNMIQTQLREEDGENNYE